MNLHLLTVHPQHMLFIMGLILSLHNGDASTFWLGNIQTHIPNSMGLLFIIDNRVRFLISRSGTLDRLHRDKLLQSRLVALTLLYLFRFVAHAVSRK